MKSEVELKARRRKKFKVTTDSKSNFPVDPILLNQEFYASSLGKARNRPITQKLVFHSGRGTQYSCEDLTKILNSNALASQNMSKKGYC